MLGQFFKEPRGFVFVQYVDPADAAEAKYQMDGQVLLGRELTVVFAEEKRKKPTEMRYRERARRRSPPPYSHSPRYSRFSPCHGRYRSRCHDYSPPKDRHYSRSVSPQERRHSRVRYSRSPPPYNGSRSRSLDRGQGPSQGRSRSPRQSRSRPPREVGSPFRSRSRSPCLEEYKRDLNGERTPSQ
ncbi:Serine/arginine-rich SC35-like splicing factor SCL30A [Hibiscus syriacus]|uniref:Serine/arginine-rich SC35-like splicing factor SCL30A n=1 Tax=Hibiscus syriacus TaxID=106335 RepID=A0A6A2YB86_HIBSY|nr:Serine/arginine-rich SC35-like splicing factor SCL30A [Hibiscus syriacus]